MDNTDIDIIKILEKNGRISHEEIAQKLHMSRPAIHKRIENLEKEGVITGYRALVNWRKVGPCIRCFIFIKINKCNFDYIAHEVTTLDIPEITVEECHRIAGEWCMVVKVRISTPEDTTKLLDHIWKLEGIMETSTTFVINTVL
ncbi:Lrp/AsnC family transcriptional regulator [Desulfosporosinus sp. OT]|uniref:Lrp/AsnC family transcriptional regulator n=1 Tax=Desulfosporosinus sp. OT TaxID=913865 RepID=UPI0002239CC0|nr:Lrp/AsnC family transcriptional regulator [Desulfosporosinus sp. OT]EGW40115.1 asnC family protein [Desulfosporosinus sp. OT]